MANDGRHYYGNVNPGKGGSGGRRAGGQVGPGMPAAANKIAPSPRRLNKEERDYADVMTNSKFRSDKKRRAEMARRGINVDPANLYKIRERIGSKVGRVAGGAIDKAAMRRAIGK